MESKGKDEIAEMASKMQKMDEMLNKEVFNNPIKDVQEKMRQELLEFKKIFLKNISELSKELNNNKASFGTSSEEVTDLKTALAHKQLIVSKLLLVLWINYLMSMGLVWIAKIQNLK